MRFVFLRSTKNYHLYQQANGGINKHYIPVTEMPVALLEIILLHKPVASVSST